jgi:UDP-GlcNAc:undecaprenyl-phosphate GlcNAc-1-phosphate transferase
VEDWAALLPPLLVSFVLALGATLACERIAPRFGLVVRPRADRWHRRAIPLLGGVAIAVGVLPVLGWVGGNRRLVALLGVALVTGAIGLADDIRPLSPPVKLVAQIIMAGILIHLGFVLRITPWPLADVFLTLVWVVGITNAVNLLDNMDGLAAGMAVITAGFRLAFFVLEGDSLGATMAAALLGALLGFLVRNFPPAKIFMGDAGSLFVGLLLSGLCLVTDAAYYSRGVTAVLIVPVLLLLIPIFDTTFVTVTRLITGRPVSRGGRDHTSHRLVALGVSERRALAFLYTVSVVSGLLAWLTYRYGVTYTIGLLALLLVALVLLAVQLNRVGGAPPDAGVSEGSIVRLVADLPFRRQMATVLGDLVLIVVAYYTAYLLRFEDQFEGYRSVFVQTLPPVIVLQIGSLAAAGVYRGLWRYTSVPDLLRLLQGSTIGTIATVAYFWLLTGFEGLSRAVFVLDWLLLVLLLCGTRLSFRMLAALRRPADDVRHVLIYGAGDGGDLTLREFQNNPALRRHAVGFLDDDRAKAGTRIQGVPVLGGVEALAAILRHQQIDEVVVSSRKIPAEQLRRLEAACAPAGIQVVRASVRMEAEW